MSGEPIFWIAANLMANEFPDVDEALGSPDGLLAAGGDLTNARLMDAYQRGIFPWYSEGQPILWWSPNPRCVLRPADLYISRRLQRRLRTGKFRFSWDLAFLQTVNQCATARGGKAGTWITGAMRDAYCDLHAAGTAHSVECWQGETLVGGVYGVAVGKVFFGESMFSGVTDGSKMCLVELAKRLTDWDYELIDCQVHNRHLESLGAICIPRTKFTAMLKSLCFQAPAAGAWQEARQ